MHLGNVWSFLLCWLHARKNHGRILLRLDDIDPKRSRAQYADQLMADLRWLGLTWDQFEGREAIRQSERGELYRGALARLEEEDLVYPCFCTRRELRSLANAPHVGDEGVPYDGRCASLSAAERRRRIAEGRAWCLRFRCPDETVSFADQVFGPQAFAKAAYGGDFALMRSDGVWSYQLASAVDDFHTGVNFVLRGRDLLPSTPRQILIARALRYQAPAYAHIPLLLDESGERLAKRHKSLSMAALRAAGVAPEAIIGYLAQKAGINPGAEPVRPVDLVRDFSLCKLPLADIRIGKRDLQGE